MFWSLSVKSTRYTSIDLCITIKTLYKQTKKGGKQSLDPQHTPPVTADGCCLLQSMQLIDGARPNKTPWNSWRQDYVHSTNKYSCFFWIKPIITSVFIISTSSTSVPNLKILLFAFINLQDSDFFVFIFWGEKYG